MEKFEVKYLKHSIFKPCETHTNTVNKQELIDLLMNGMVTVLEVKLQIKQEDLKYEKSKNL